MTRIQPWTEEQLMTHEQVFEGLVSKAVRQTVKAAISSFKEEVTTAAAEPAPAIEYSSLEGTVLATWQGFVDSELFPFLTDTFLTSAERVADGVTAASGEFVDRVTNTYAKDFLQYAYNRMVFTGQQLWEKIRGELVEGYAAGESIQQLTQRLQLSAGLALPRALTVARTEVISAANGGSYVQMLEAGFTEKVTKEWLATMDTRTRESHRHADNQTVELTDGFSVDIYTSGVKTGTEELEFPGDPTGTPGNIINCRCSLAFDFEDDDDEDEEAMTAAFVEKKHPRDKDGKFKKKGAADLYVPKLEPYGSKDSDVAAVKNVAGQINQLKDQQASTFVQKMTKQHWNALSDEEKQKVNDRWGSLKGEHIDAAKAHLAFLQGADEPDDEGDSDARPTGGTVTKTGKKWTPGQPVAMKVQFLYNTTFEPGAVMAVRKDSGERLVWNGTTKKIERQTNKDGSWATTESLTRGDFYKKYNAEEGWTIPEAGQTKAEPASVAPGKPVALKVQLLFNTKFAAGDVMAERVDSDERLVWNGKKVERQKWNGSDWETTETLTRGATMAKYKDESGWTTPTGAVGVKGATPDKQSVVNDAQEASQPVSPVQKPAAKKIKKYVAPKALGGEANDTIGAALYDDKVPVGTVLFESGALGVHTTLTKSGEGKIKFTHVPFTGAPGEVETIVPLNPSTLDLAKGINAAKAAAGKTTPKSLDDQIADWKSGDIDDFGINDVMYEDDVIEIEKLNAASVMLINKKNGEFKQLDLDDISLEQIEDFKEQSATPVALPLPSPALAMAAPAISPDKAVTLKAWADLGDIKAGEELHNGTNFKIVKGAPGAVVVYKKDSSGHIDSNTGIVLSGDQITQDNLLKAVNGEALPKVSAETKQAQDIFTQWQNSTAGVPKLLLDEGDAGLVIKKQTNGQLLIVGPQAENIGILTPQSITPENVEKAIAAVKAGNTFNVGDPIPDAVPTPAPVVVTGKTVTQSVAPQVPLKMSYNLLVNPKTTKYTDGQVIAEHPGENEQLVWNGQTKKFDVYAKNDANTWVKVHSYTKQGAYKNLKDDQGWVTPSASSTTPAPSAPAVAGNPSAPSVTIPKAKTADPVVFSQARGDVSHLTPEQLKDIYQYLRNKTSAGSSINTFSAPESLFQALVDTRVHFDKQGTQLSLLQVLRAVDIEGAKAAGVPNGNLYEKKVHDWLKTSAGAEQAGKIFLEMNLTPAQKAALKIPKIIEIFDKKGLLKKQTATDAYKKMDAVPVSSPEVPTVGTTFPVVASVSAGNAIAAKMDKKFATLTPAQKKAAQHYTGSGSTGALNLFGRTFGQQGAQWAQEALDLQKAMSGISENITLYRNVDTVFDNSWTPSVQDINDLVASGKKFFYEDGFGSSSIDPNVFGSKKYRYVIEVPKGTPALWVEGNSSVNGEKEFVLAAGMRFEVFEAVQVGGKIVIKMRVVPK